MVGMAWEYDINKHNIYCVTWFGISLTHEMVNGGFERKCNQIFWRIINVIQTVDKLKQNLE